MYIFKRSVCRLNYFGFKITDSILDTQNVFHSEIRLKLYLKKKNPSFGPIVKLKRVI